MTRENCEGQHHYFVPDDGIVFLEAERRLCLVIVCTACGATKMIEHNVAQRSKSDPRTA